MKNKQSDPEQAAYLRRRAEAQVRAHAAAQSTPLTPVQAAQLTYELQVHKIELELQNEELRRAQAALEASQARYFDLYDLAPVGYLTLSADGLIQETNLNAANLLGVTRAQLVQRPLGSLVCKEDQDDYYRYRQQLDSPLAPTATSAALTCELRMKRAGDTLWARLDAARAQDDSGAPVIRVTLSDITERKQLEGVQAFLSQHEGAVVGASFFEALASYLARTLAMDFVCIDRLEGDGLTAQTVAVWCDGKFEDNTAYALKDTPCGDVVGQAVCCFPASVCQHFPRDTVLKDLRAESYLGVTLWNHAGQPIGLIAVIGRKPLSHRPLAETVLKMVAVRAGAELERLATEAELQKSEARYALTLAAVNDGLWDWNPTTGEAWFSPTYYALLGYADREFAAQYATWRLLVHPDDLARVEAELQRCIENITGFAVDLRMMLKSGDWLWVSTRGKVVERDAAGKTLRMVGTLSDITERKQAEEALREQEESYRTLADSGRALIWTSGTDKKCDYFNQPWLQFTGRTLAQELGDGWAEGVHPEDLARCFKIYTEAFDRQESFSMDYRLRRHDGEFRWIQDEGTPRHDSRGKFLGYIGHCLDITERKQAAAALQASSDRLTLATRAAGLGIWEYDVANNRLTWDDQMYRLYGITALEFSGAYEAWQQGVHPEDRQRGNEEIQQALRGEKDFETEFRVLWPDGSTHYLSANSIVERDAAGKGRRMVGTNQDITARKRAAEQLRQNESRLQAITNSAQDAIVMMSPEGRISFWNPAAEHIFGYTSAEALGQKLHALIVPPRYHAAHQAAFPAFQQTGQGAAIGKTLDLEARRKDGREFSVQLSLSAVELEGRWHAVGLIRDITERKQAEMALRESEERHRVVTDTMLHGLVHQLGNGTITAMNPAAERILGRTIAEFIGSNSIQEEHHTIHEDGSPFPGQEHPAMVVLRTGQSICNVVMGVWNPQRKERRWIEVDAVPVFAPGQASPTEVYTVFADITERKRAEAALQLQGAALAAAANAIVITDAQGTIEWSNPAFSVLSGYTGEETIGKNPRDLVKSGQQTAAFYQELWDTIRAGQVWHGELVNRRKDGTLYSEDMTITPLRAVGHAITHFIGIKQNVTERKEMEKQLLRSQRLESVGRLAGGIAHDLNNILAPVLLAPPLLREAIRDPDTRNMVDLIETSTKRGAEIIKQLLTFSRGLKGERVPLQLSLLVREMRSLMRETFPKNITVRLQLPAEVPLVLSDTTQLHQVLMNLCVNARDAMPDGGELTLSLEALTLDTAAAAAIPGARAGSFIVLGVGDTGTGIAPEILEKIYDPFFTTKAVGKGSGLGLSTTLGIVRSHAGFIQVRSAPGQGTLFRVFLPVSKQSVLVDSTAAAELPTAPQGHGEQVLVVDDEKHLRLMARKILEGNGYRILEAEDGAEALRLLESGNGLPQVVLTDLLMPRMDGPQLIRALRQLPVPPKIVVMGGIPPPPETLQELGLTAQAFIAKPFDAATLLNALHAVLS